jgi:hypothetical protein
MWGTAGTAPECQLSSAGNRTKMTTIRWSFLGLRVVIAAGSFAGAHFGLCYILPQSGPGSFLFPFGSAELQGGVDTTLFGALHGIWMVVMIGVAGLAVLAFCAAFAASFDWYVSTIYLRPLILTGAVLSCAIYSLHLGTRSLMPLTIDAALIYAAVASGWIRTVRGQ